MKLKNHLLSSLSLAVLLIMNFGFFNTYFKAYKISKYGERVEVQVESESFSRPFELLPRPYRGTWYEVRLDKNTREVYTKSILKIGSKVNVIISPFDKTKVFLNKKEGSVLSVLNGMSGSPITSFILMFGHLCILGLTCKITLILYKTIKKGAA